MWCCDCEVGVTHFSSDGNVVTLPRLQCWMSDVGVVADVYQKEPALPWNGPIGALKTRLETLLKCKFDYVLMNYYRDGNDSIGTFICALMRKGWEPPRAHYDFALLLWYIRLASLTYTL